MDVIYVFSTESDLNGLNLGLGSYKSQFFFVFSCWLDMHKKNDKSGVV
jgi:hypothetical protein